MRGFVVRKNVGLPTKHMIPVFVPVVEWLDRKKICTRIDIEEQSNVRRKKRADEEICNIEVP